MDVNDGRPAIPFFTSASLLLLGSGAASVRPGNWLSSILQFGGDSPSKVGSSLSDGVSMARTAPTPAAIR